MNGDNQNKQQAIQADCEQLRDLLPAYSMNITDPDETRLVERLLAECPEVADEWTDYQHMAEAMLFSAPQHAAPAHIADNLKALTSDTPGHSSPPPGKMTLLSMSINPVILSMAAALAILLVAAGYLFIEVSNLRDQQDQLETELATSEALLTLFETAEVFRFEFAGVGEYESTDVNGTLICNPNYTLAHLRVQNFAPLPDDMTYQIWLIRNSERTSAGLLNVNERGEGTLVFDAPLPMGEFQYIGITPEPAGGSEGPTSDPVIQGRLY